MRGELPTGTVTFVFTDVEGSTRLLRELGAERYAAVLEEHRRVIRAACAANGGIEVDTQGDAFFLAFPTAHGAMETAASVASVVDGLASAAMRVRVGVHTGTPLVTSEGYVGEDVHRAARIAAAGHGGQVLVSASTAELTGHALRDLGEHRLKDLTAPQRLFQLGNTDFPPVRSLRLTNLPVPVTPFIGREQELAEVVDMMAAADTRLLTLTGPGGTGKTRLAAQAAGLAADVFPDGVWWVPLSNLRDPALVLPTVSQTVGAQDELDRHIRDRRMLILLDNFEHVVDAADDLGPLLSGCRNLTLLITSREPLHLAREQVYSVHPFDPDEAVALFLARARAVGRTVSGGSAVREICRRLDELPLALELAAARVKVLTPEQILERLDRRLPLLTGGARDAPERQRTLRAAIEWSYELLTSEEQRLFAALSVFAESFSLEAAETVAHADLDALQSLVDKSLVRVAEGRYAMLATIREYAASLAGADDRVRDRHVRFFLALVEEAEPHLTGREQQEWFERLAREHANIVAALQYACERGDAERAVMLAGTFWRYWWTRGPVEEMNLWYERVLAVNGEVSDLARARAIFGVAHVAELRGDVERTRDLFLKAADLLRSIGETRWLVLALTHLAGTYEIERAEQIQLQAIELAEKHGDVRGAAIARGNLAAQLGVRAEQRERVLDLLRAALDGHRQLGDAYGIATALQSLAAAELLAGDTQTAAAQLAESLELSQAIGDMLTTAGSLILAAGVALAWHEQQLAAQLLGASEAHARELGIDLSTLGWESLARIRDDVASNTREASLDGTGTSPLTLERAVRLALDALTGAPR